MDELSEVIAFATQAHEGQYRKVGKTPFIFHPFEVAGLVSTMRGSKEAIYAALLHDTVEDTDVTMQEIVNRFGSRVGKLVASETEDKMPGVPAADSWQMRKDASLEILRCTDDMDVKKMWLADKLSNLRSLNHALILHGEGAWNNFHQQNPKAHAWYYGEIKNLLKDLEGYPEYVEYCKLYNDVFGGEE